MKKILFLVSIAFAFAASAATISNLSVRQQWPWSQKVDIDYTLSADTPQRVDVALYSGNTKLTIPQGAFSGDIFGVTNGGVRTIVFDPLKTAYTNQVLANLHFVLTPYKQPFYEIVDLTKTPGADGQIEYVYVDDTRLETYGRFTNVWFSVTNDAAYATDKLVLRYVPAGEFLLNSSYAVKLTKPFFAGVFELTQRQYELVTGANPSYYNNSSYYARRPVSNCSYDTIRGTTNGTPAIDWPATRYQVSPGSFMGKLRSKSGIDTFDLPTNAQWEYFCRAGTTTLFNDGDTSANYSGTNNQTNVWLNALARYQYNGGYCFNSLGKFTFPGKSCSSDYATARAGAYQPNNWGIFDAHGNVWEWVLDYYGSLSAATDPAGLSTGTQRTIRGGDYTGAPNQEVSGARYFLDSNVNQSWLGFRVVQVLF